jgi:simple sugar transport system permease protein
MKRIWIGLAIVLSPFVLFALFLLSQGANPLESYEAMFRSAFGDWYGIGEVAIKSTPFLLTALAVAIPARAGLINVGGEGQLMIGALFTTWVGVFYLQGVPAWFGVPVLIVVGAIGGAIWGMIPALLRQYARMNETITTLLLNYVAFFTVGYFVHGPLKDPESFNWPFSPKLDEALRLPTFGSTRVHIGFLIAAVAAVLVWFVIFRTRVGFRLRVIGGNAVAALQAGIKVNRMQLLAMVFGGAMAGIAGMIEIAGIEGHLRPMTGFGYGYIGFLAAWMAWNHPIWTIATAFLLGAISVAGNALEMTSGLPSSSVSILMAFILLTVLAVGRGSKSA